MKKILSIVLSAGIALATFTSNVNAAGTATAKNTNSNTTEVHDKKGRLLYSVKRYDESQLPKDVRSLVRSQYYDFNIMGVEEVTVPFDDNKIYLVHVQDDTHVKTIRVYDGELTVTGDYIRG